MKLFVAILLCFIGSFVCEDFIINERCGWHGFDLYNIENISSVNECAAECLKKLRCTHITYNGKNKFCFLQHADTKQQILDTRYDSYNYAWCAFYSGEDRFVAEPSLTTMKPETAPIPDSVLKNFIIKERCGWNGFDLSNVENISSVNECVAQCYKIFSCTHVTYNGKNKFCFLQHADTKQQILDTRYDSYSYAWCVYYNGEDRFGAPAAITTIKPETGTTLDSVLKQFTIDEKCEHRNYGFDHRKDIPTAAVCAAECFKTLGCTHATYDGNNKICYFKHAATIEQIRGTRWNAYNTWCIRYNGRDRFGVQPVFTTTLAATTIQNLGAAKFQIDKDCQYRSYDVAERNNIPVFNICAAHCFKMTRCTHATYDGNKKICYLKHASSKEQIRDSRMNSFNVWCLMYNGAERYEQPD